MKPILLLSVFLLLGLISQVEAETPSSDFLLTPNSAGRIKLGASKQEVLRLYRDHHVKEVDLLLEGLPAPALKIFKGQDLLLTAELLNDTVYRIHTTNPKFATREGIRVGSTLGEAKRHLGRPNLLEGERGVFAAYDFKLGALSFLLHVEPDPLPEYVTDQSKILMILVVRPP